jgi:hypothetical protein
MGEWFKKDGFLAAEAEGFRTKIRAREPVLFEMAARVNRIAQDLKHIQTIQWNESRDPMICALFCRSADSFAAAVKLAEYGLATDAEIAARTVFETALTLRACVHSEELFSGYILEGKKSEKTILEKMKKANASVEVWKQNAEWVTNRIREIDEEVVLEQKTAKWMNVEQLSDLFGMGPLYQNVYRHFSQAAHATPRSLMSVFEMKDERPTGLIHHGPEPDRIELILMSACQFLGISCQGFASYFKIPQDEISGFLDSLYQLGAKLGAKLKTPNLK